MIYRFNACFWSSSCTGEFSVMSLTTANLRHHLSKYQNNKSPKRIKAEVRKSLTQQCSDVKNKRVALWKDGAAPRNGSIAYIGWVMHCAKAPDRSLYHTGGLPPSKKGAQQFSFFCHVPQRCKLVLVHEVAFQCSKGFRDYKIQEEWIRRNFHFSQAKAESPDEFRSDE